MPREKKTSKANQVPTSPGSDMIPLPKAPEKGPVVFMFQPKDYRPPKTPEDLALWETWMIERVGLNPDAALFSRYRELRDKSIQPYLWPGGGISGSNGDWDD